MLKDADSINKINTLSFSESNFEALKKAFFNLNEDINDLNQELNTEKEKTNKLNCELTEAQKETNSLNQELKIAQEKITWFEEQFKINRQRQFGRSSERSNEDNQGYPKQQLLFDAAVADDIETKAETENITYTRRKPKQKKGCGRKLDTSKLPRERIVHDISEVDKKCSCGNELVKIGENISEQLEFIPATLKVIEHVTPKYACGNKECGIVKQGKKAESMISVIPKSMAGNSLITEAVIKKYQHHQPLYRQSKIFNQEGLDIPDNTLGNWVMKAGRMLEPLGDTLWQQIEKTKVLQTDETPVLVLSNNKKGYMWVYHGCDPGNLFVIFEYANSRGGKVVNARLDNYRGILQTDGYSGYNVMRGKEGVVNIGCWAHARRKFKEITKISKTKGKAHEGLEYIDNLYHIETEVKKAYSDKYDDLYFKTRHELRQKKARIILDDFKGWLDKTIAGVPPKSALGAAILYTLNQWPYLYEYINHGEVEIDNNWVENEIRPFALGRKNWLFIGNEGSAAISARYYSLIQTCILNNINPRKYLNYVFGQAHKMRREEIDPKKLLPQFIDRNLLT
jgi:transposase